jgi:hypothetical protein
MYVSVLSVDPRMYHEVFFNIRWVYCTVYSAFMSYAEFSINISVYNLCCRVYDIQALKMSTVTYPHTVLS